MTAARITVIATMRITPIPGETASSSVNSSLIFIVRILSPEHEENLRRRTAYGCVAEGGSGFKRPTTFAWLSRVGLLPTHTRTDHKPALPFTGGI
jgi:hypothetical protein